VSPSDFGVRRSSQNPYLSGALDGFSYANAEYLQLVERKTPAVGESLASLDPAE
jgi:hypothetical protein